MNLEEYEEQLAKQTEPAKKMKWKLEVGEDVIVGFDPPVWQREMLAEYVRGDPETVRRHVFEGQRRTGRTTRMVFQALIAASEGKRVYIVAHNQTMSREIKRMVEAAAGSIQYDTRRLPEYVHNIRYFCDDAAIRGRLNVDGNSIILYDNAIEDMRNGL